jgi:uncharacterized protein (DUF1684 family)
MIMNNQITLLILALLVYGNLTGQKPYTQELKTFQEAYMANHEVVKGKDKKYFRFFPIEASYKINGAFEKLNDSIGFTMKTSGTITKHYFKYGTVTFSLKDTALQLFVYQSKDLMKTDQYKDYLFIPFTDLTTGDEAYGSGRYLDFTIDSIKNNLLALDFNKAYNPYCAYATGFRCPIPPRENYLPVAVRAGEKVFGKSMH